MQDIRDNLVLLDRCFRIIIKIYMDRARGCDTFHRIQFVITEISVLRVNYFDGKKIINLILHFIYATLFM